MKHYYALSFLFLLISIGTKAQNPVSIREDSLSFGNSTMPGYSVIIPEVDYEKTMKEWVKTLQSGTKSKVVEENGKMSIFGARVKKISDNPINIYSTLANESDALNLKVAFESERDRFIGDAEGSAAKEFLFDFAKERYVELVSDQLEAEKKTLKSFENDLNSLERKQARMEETNRDNTQMISSEKERLAVLNESLDSVPSDARVESGMGARDDKDLEKERKKISRDIKSTEDKIERAEKEVARNEKELPQNTNEQEVLRKKIAEQEAVVKKFEKKLDNIKRSRL